MDMSQYLEIFIDESKEHLQHMNTILLDLENNTEDLNLLNEIFRIAHTIKGMAGTMGFTQVANVTHEMENVLHKVRNGEIPVTTVIVDVLFECFDMLEDHINSLESTGQESSTDASPLVKKLQDILINKGSLSPTTPVEEKEESEPEETHIETTTSADGFSLDLSDIGDVLKEAMSQALHPLKIRVTLDENCMLKAARSFIVFNTLEQSGEIVKSHPAAEDIEDEKFERSFEVLYITNAGADIIQHEIANISEISDVYVEEVESEEIVTTSVAPVVEEEIVEVKEVEEVITETVVTPAAPTPAAKKPVKRGKETEDKKQAKDKAKTSKTVRVDIDRLDNLMNLVSELIIIKTRLEVAEGTGNRSNMDDAVEYLERITTSLHDAVMKVRMVPVERTFNRFPRMVRDLSKDLGKNIQLIMSGEETEVDRTVIDEIGDPLIHLIRNSIDHGIENPEDRASRGKKEKGTVALRAYPDGNTVVIEVEDDGGGIDPEKILGIAQDKGVVSDREVETMSDKDIINLLFRPGFSTAEKITDLSGRGVGLDVVKSKIESLNGTVEVDSELTKGSKFTIRLPLTLAIIQALMVNLAEEKYALPLNNIKEITTIEKASISMVQNQEVVLYRNKTLPIIRLSDVLEVPYNEEPEEKNEMIVVIVRKGELEAGLVVDSLIGQQEIVIKSLGRYLTGAKTIAGATILGNGSVALIVDPNQLL